MTDEQTGELTDREIRLRVSDAVQQLVAQGWRVESEAVNHAVLVGGRRPNHILHLLLCIPTVGVWLPVWAFIAWRGGERRCQVTVSRFGDRQVNKL